MQISRSEWILFYVSLLIELMISRIDIIFHSLIIRSRHHALRIGMEVTVAFSILKPSYYRRVNIILHNEKYSHKWKQVYIFEKKNVKLDK